MAGLLVAFLGVFLGQLLHSHYPDVIASMIIGLILAVVAIFLIYESKSLLIGESADAEIIAAVQKTVQEHPAVIEARRPLTMQLSPAEVFLALDVQFKPEIPASELVSVVDELEEQIHQKHTNVGQIFIEIRKLKEGEEKDDHK